MPRAIALAAGRKGDKETMPEDKGFGAKLLGIFVETDNDKPDESSAEKSPAELVAELANQAGPKRPPQEAPPPNLQVERLKGAGAAEGAALDFDTIFREAGMDVAELDRVKKAEELLKGLPEATPHAIKKQIVEASLKAFGFEVERIVAAAQNQKRALDTYVRVNESATAKSIQDAEQQIQSLNEKIASLRQDIEKRTGQLRAVTTAAQNRKVDVQKVLDFFQPPAPSTPPGPTGPTGSPTSNS
jgi:hypothetical protein